MISRTAEYALRALVHMASVYNEQPLETVEQIAAVTKVPVGYLAKVLQSLTRAGLLISQRGIGGGFRLAKAPGETSVYEVIQAVDPIPRILVCPLGLEWHSTHLCPLHKSMDDAMSVMEAQFRATTIENLIEPLRSVEHGASEQETCDFPRGMGTSEAAATDISPSRDAL